MKVAVLSSFTTSLFWFRLDMMRAFIKAGYDVIAVGDGIETEWTEKFALEGIRYKQIPVQRNGTNPIKDIDTIRALIKLLNDEKPDKIFAYQAKTVCYGGFAARVTKINEFYPLIAGLGSVFLGNGIKNRLLKTILVLEYKIGMKKAPGYFFQNQDDLKVFVDNKIVDPAKVTMIHGSGVNIEKFARTPLPENPTFLCISRLIRDKGVFEYLEACRLLKNSYPNVRCTLIGPFDTNPSALTKNDLQSYIEGTILRRNKVDGMGRHPWKAEVTEGDTAVTAETVANWYKEVYEPSYATEPAEETTDEANTEPEG